MGEGDRRFFEKRRLGSIELAPHEAQHVVAQSCLVRVRDTVRRAFVHDERCTRHEPFGGARGGADRDDLIVVTMNDERGPVEALEVLGEVRRRERGNAIVGVLVPAVTPWRQKLSIMPCDGVVPRRLKPKNGPLAISR